MKGLRPESLRPESLRPESLRPESLRLKSLRPAVLVVDVSADLSLATRAMEAALVTARATQGRAEMLLALCKASPELLDKARGIYERAGARVWRLQGALDKAASRLEGAS